MTVDIVPGPKRGEERKRYPHPTIPGAFVRRTEKQAIEQGLAEAPKDEGPKSKPAPKPKDKKTEAPKGGGSRRKKDDAGDQGSEPPAAS